MPKMNEKVMAMVRREVGNDPRVKNKELIAKAKRIDRSVARLGARQFHALYRLRATRELAAETGSAETDSKPSAAPRKSGRKRSATARKSGRKRAATARKSVRRRSAAPREAETVQAAATKAPAANRIDRAAVRAVLVDLATDVAGALDKAAVIGVIASLDRYVDRVERLC